jgi:hypothetical protein
MKTIPLQLAATYATSNAANYVAWFKVNILSPLLIANGIYYYPCK